jgi:hypothetical protein
MLGFF